jgi:hypothetical protein
MMKLEEALSRLGQICRAIAKGNYDYIQLLDAMTLAGPYPEEISGLAESFSLMLLKLQAHEEKLDEALSALKKKNHSLQDKVHAMKIDINQIKKANAINKITQTEFFKEIAHKAKQRRKK